MLTAKTVTMQFVIKTIKLEASPPSPSRKAGNLMEKKTKIIIGTVAAVIVGLAAAIVVAIHNYDCEDEWD